VAATLKRYFKRHGMLNSACSGAVSLLCLLSSSSLNMAAMTNMTATWRLFMPLRHHDVLAAA